MAETRERNLPSNTAKPEIFQLLEVRAGRRQIVEQIKADFQADEIERVLIGFRELIRRGNGGLAAIDYLAHHSEGGLSEMAGKINGKFTKSADPLALEKLLDINRFPYRYYNLITPLRKSSAIIYERSKQQGYIDPNMTLEEFWQQNDDRYEQYLRYDEPAPQLSGKVEDEVFVISHTFAPHQPSYLEMLGPEGIVQLKSEPQPSMLLLGSLGKYSALEFNQYARRMNPNANTHCVDIKPDDSNRDKNQPEKGLYLTMGDATRLPYRANSLDQIYTNSLVHNLMTPGIPRLLDGVDKLMHEVALVLKPQGTLLMVESLEGFCFRNGVNEEQFVEEIIKRAEKNGLKMEICKPNGPIFTLRPEMNNLRISQNGLVYYDGLIVMDSPLVNLKFVKE